MKSEPIRILHVLQRMEAGGTQALLMNLYRNIDRTKVQFDFLVEYNEKQFYDDEILSMGGKIYYSNVRNDKNIFKFQKFLKNILKENNYKIIHVHAYTIGYFVLKTAKKCDVPIRIAHSHSNNMTNDLKKIYKKVMKKLFSIYATNFMACSKEAGEFLFNDKDFIVLSNGIDTSKFKFNSIKRNELREKFNLENNFVVGHVGRFRPEKNHDFLLDIFANIKSKHLNAKLILIGNGDPNEKIIEKIKKLNIEDDVLIFKDRKDVNELYNIMDIFVFPSIYEGLGIVSIEAQANGLTVFASDRLPIEVEVTNTIYRIPLEKSASYWANFIDNNLNDRNTEAVELIQKKGFDIKSSASFIENYYLNAIENN